MKNAKLIVVAGSALALAAVGGAQFKQILKVVGVGAAVKQFGPQINTAMNRLTKFSDSEAITTKVVPIISAGINSRQAVGAAQVMGPRHLVEKVAAVAELDQDILGREVKIQAMIPVSSKDFSDIKRVEGVGVSGLVNLKL